MINYSNLKIDIKAADEILDVFEYYETINADLGQRFQADIEKAVQKILRNPFAFSKIKKTGKSEE